MDAIHSRLHAFLLNLECLDVAGQRDAVYSEVMETFGRFDPPAGDRSHRWDLDLHGVQGCGASEEEAIANWKRLARDECELDAAEDDGFITVRPDLRRKGAA